LQALDWRSTGRRPSFGQSETKPNQDGIGNHCGSRAVRAFPSAGVASPVPLSTLDSWQQNLGYNGGTFSL